MATVAFVVRRWALLGQRGRTGASPARDPEAPTVEEAAALSPEWGRVEARRLSAGGRGAARWEPGARRYTV